MLKKNKIKLKTFYDKDRTCLADMTKDSSDGNSPCVDKCLNGTKERGRFIDSAIVSEKN